MPARRMLLTSLTVLLPFLVYAWNPDIVFSSKITNFAVANLISIASAFTLFFVSRKYFRKEQEILRVLHIRNQEGEAERYIPQRFTTVYCQTVKKFFVIDVARILLEGLNRRPIYQKLFSQKRVIKWKFAESLKSLAHIPPNERYAYWLEQRMGIHERNVV